MRKTTLIFGLAFTVLPGWHSARADLLTIYDRHFAVDAEKHSYMVPLSTGLQILNGDRLSFSTDSADTWILYNQPEYVDEYTTDAAGLSSHPIDIDGITFNAGMLAGTIGTGGSYFQIGTSRSLTSSAAGELYLLCWDNPSRYENNLGTIDVSVLVQRETPVPEPGTLLLFGSGLAGLGGASRRRKTR